MAMKKNLSAILNLNNVFQKSLDLAQAATTCCLAANSLRTTLGLVSDSGAILIKLSVLIGDYAENAGAAGFLLSLSLAGRGSFSASSPPMPVAAARATLGAWSPPVMLCLPRGTGHPTLGI